MFNAPATGQVTMYTCEPGSLSMQGKTVAKVYSSCAWALYTEQGSAHRAYLEAFQIFGSVEAYQSALATILNRQLWQHTFLPGTAAALFKALIAGKLWVGLFKASTQLTSPAQLLCEPLCAISLLPIRRQGGVLVEACAGSPS